MPFFTMYRVGAIFVVFAVAFFFTTDFVVPAQAMDEEVFKSLVALAPQQNLADEFAIYATQYDWMWPLRQPDGSLAKHADVSRYVLLERLATIVSAECQAKEKGVVKSENESDTKLAAEALNLNSEQEAVVLDLDSSNLKSEEDPGSVDSGEEEDSAQVPKPVESGNVESPPTKSDFKSKCPRFENFLPWLEGHKKHESIVASMQQKKHAPELIDLLEMSRFTPDNLDVLFRTWSTFPEFAPWTKLTPKVFASRMAFLETAFAQTSLIVKLKEQECQAIKSVIPTELDGSYGWTTSVLAEIKEKCLVGKELVTALERCDAMFLEANTDVSKVFKWHRECRVVYKIKQDRDYWGRELTLD